jgi:hypothetical protein
MAMKNADLVALALVSTGQRLHEARREAGLETDPYPLSLKPKFANTNIDVEGVIAALPVEVVASVVRAFSSSDLDELVPLEWQRAALGDEAIAALEPTIRSGPFAEYERNHAIRANLVRFDIASELPGRAWGVRSGSIADTALVIGPSGTATQILMTPKGRVIDHAVHQQTQRKSIEVSIAPNGTISLRTTALYLDPTTGNVDPAIKSRAFAHPLSAFKSTLTPTSWPNCPAASAFFKKVTFIAPTPTTTASNWKGSIDEVVDLGLGVATIPGGAKVTNRLTVEFSTDSSGAMSLTYQLVDSPALDVDSGSLTAASVRPTLGKPGWNGKAVPNGPTTEIDMFELRGEKNLRFKGAYQPPPIAVAWVWAWGSQVFNEACVP